MPRRKFYKVAWRLTLAANMLVQVRAQTRSLSHACAHTLSFFFFYIGLCYSLWALSCTFYMFKRKKNNYVMCVCVWVGMTGLSAQGLPNSYTATQELSWVTDRERGKARERERDGAREREAAQKVRWKLVRGNVCGRTVFLYSRISPSPHSLCFPHHHVSNSPSFSHTFPLSVSPSSHISHISSFFCWF